MGFINKLEQGLEKAVRGTFSGGNSRFEPADLANRIRTEMDDRSYSIESGHTLAPNVFTLYFATEDFPRVKSWGTPLAEELCDVAIRQARAQGYSLRGAVRVTFIREDSLHAGDFKISSAQEKISTGEVPSQQSRPSVPRPHHQDIYRQNSAGTSQGSYSAHEHSPSWDHQLSDEAVEKTQVVLNINGQNYSIDSFPVVLGRGAQADITVEDSGVSRYHLEIMEQDGTYLAVDLGSTNGSYLNGQKLRGRRELTHGSILKMGRARIIFRLMVPRSAR
ncbi:FhaA domain-containing protein [Rothia sp. CCM 9418]|uniref:FhaA domain-containing protein n=1 Tax=Rothia sp. CCM 9418 TaxID=3402661 RepID=UPI003AD96FB4